MQRDLEYFLISSAIDESANTTLEYLLGLLVIGGQVDLLPQY
jgi:hypothetical protein